MTLRRTLLSLLWPNRCDCCGSLIPAEPFLCEDCIRELDALRAVPADWIRSSGVTEPVWDGAAVCFAYRGRARDGILAAKDGYRGFVKYAGDLLAEAVREQLPERTFDFVTWVPIERRRRRVQGYSHAENLGRSLAAALDIPARDGLLADHSRTVRQHALPARARRAFVSERFTHTGADLTGQHILLCDDVLTTGNTLKRCTVLLKECGAASVCIAAAAVRLRSSGEPARDA